MTKYMSHCSPDLRNQPQIGILGQLQPTTPDWNPGPTTTNNTRYDSWDSAKARREEPDKKFKSGHPEAFELFYNC